VTFSPGAPVRVRDEWPERDGPVHVRTPHYVRGRSGAVVRPLGVFPDPGDIAFARQPAERRLYHVAFSLRELWPDATGEELVVEIYEHWLEPEARR
jgi:nitrile hydratase